MGGGACRGVVLVLASLVAALTWATPAVAKQLPTDGTPLCGTEQPSAGAPAPTADDGVLRIATFNLLHSETEEGDESLGPRLPLLAGAIATAGADIVGAQEVTRNVTFDPAAESPQKHGVVAQRLAAAVATATGQPWSWCWSLSNPHVPGTPDVNVGGGNPLDEQAAARGNFPEEGDFAEGLAILTRLPIETSRFRRLPPRSYEAIGCVNPDPFCPPAALFDSRQVLWARVAAPAGHVDVFTTHIAHTLTPLSDTTKLVQTQLAAGITEQWATPDPLPDVLLGDFNSVPGSPVHAEMTGRQFVDAWAAGGGVECTAPGEGGCSGGPTDGEEVYSAAAARAMGARIDYVFVRPPDGCSLAVSDPRRIGDTAAPLADGRFLWPSDHYGFVASVACTAAAAPTAAPSGAADASAGAVSGTAQPGLAATGGGPVPAVWASVALVGLVGLVATMRRRSDPRRVE